MAWLFGDGFDFTTDATQLLLGNWSATNFSPTILSGSSTRFNYGNCVKLGSFGSEIDKNSLANTTEAILAFAVFWDKSGFSGTTNSGLYVAFRDGTTVQTYVQFSDDGNIYVKNTSGTIIGTWTAPNGWTDNSWHHFQIKIKIDNAAGAVTIRHNGHGSDDYTATGLNTRSGTANAYFNSLAFIGSSSGPLCPTRIDDVLLFDTGGAAPNTWVGDVRAAQLMPNADTAQKDFTRSTGSNNYALVDETSPNGDTDYVESATAGNKDLYDFPNLPYTPTAIICVQAKMFVEKTDAGFRESAIYYNSGGTTGIGSTLTLGLNYQWQIDAMPTDPNTSAAWTNSAISALQLGPKVQT